MYKFEGLSKFNGQNFDGNIDFENVGFRRIEIKFFIDDQRVYRSLWEVETFFNV